MSNQERIEKLVEFRSRERFGEDDLDDREFEPTYSDTIEKMHSEVERFTNFLIDQLSKNVTNLQVQTQLFFNAWDNEYFSQEETEYIVEIEYEAMRIAGINIEKLMI